MLSQQYRLKKDAHIQELRRKGRSWSNRQVVLILRENDGPHSRFAFSVSRRIGQAVVRNKVKRLMRESVRKNLPSIAPGWDVLLIARQPARTATFAQVDQAITELLKRTPISRQPSRPQMCTTPQKGGNGDSEKASVR